MFDAYERSVLALAGYSKYYGVDDEDEKVFREYLLFCKASNKTPNEDICSIMGYSGQDRTSYHLPLLRAQIELVTTIRTSYSEHDEIIRLLPPLFVDHIENEWSVSGENFSVKRLCKWGVLDKIFSKFAGVEYEIVASIGLTKKIEFKTDIDGCELIDNAWDAYGDISISDQWKVLNLERQNKVSDISIVVKN